jgi:protein-L-isoaspartate(D-aspartate) O-methyltransferase
VASRASRASGAKAPGAPPAPAARRRPPPAVAAAVRLLLAALILSTGAGAGVARGADAEAARRREMVDGQIRGRGIADPAVLAAMAQVPRHLFVPEAYRAEAYDDRPLPIGYGQTISQPYIVALTTSLLELDGDDAVLEIGTGSGYHTAVLARIARRVYSMEIIAPIGEQARARLARLGYGNVEVRVGDGYQGWPEKAPFDAVILTAAPPYIPQPLIDQLKVGGRMVAPVGEYFQDLLVITKTADGLQKRTVIPVRLPPMTGEVRGRDR